MNIYITIIIKFIKIFQKNFALEKDYNIYAKNKLPPLKMTI